MTTFVIALRKRGEKWEGALVINGEFEEAIKDENIDEYVLSTVAAATEGQPDGQRMTVTINVGRNAEQAGEQPVARPKIVKRAG